MRVRDAWGVGLVCALGLAGCDASDATRLALVAGHDAGGAQSHALQATAAAFVGDGSRAGGTGRAQAAGLPFGSIDPDLFAPDSDTPYRATLDRGLGLRLSHRVPLGGATALEASVLGGVGQSRYHLPRGMGALVDPAEIRFTSVTLAPEIAVVQQVRLGPYDLSAQVGVGQQFSRTRTSLQSALLDVHHRSDASLGYLTLGLALTEPESGVSVALDVRAPDSDQIRLRSELRLPLGR